MPQSRYIALNITIIKENDETLFSLATKLNRHERIVLELLIKKRYVEFYWVQFDKYYRFTTRTERP